MQQPKTFVGRARQQLELTRAVEQRTDWLKFKNPDAPAVKREAEEEWGKEKWR